MRNRMSKMFSCVSAASTALLVLLLAACGASQTQPAENMPVVEKEVFPWDTLDEQSRAFYSEHCLQATEDHALLMELPVADVFAEQESNVVLQYRKIPDTIYYAISSQQLSGPKSGLTVFTFIADPSTEPANIVGMYVEYNVYKKLIENPDWRGGLV